MCFLAIFIGAVLALVYRGRAAEYLESAAIKMMEKYDPEKPNLSATKAWDATQKRVCIHFSNQVFHLQIF